MKKSAKAGKPAISPMMRKVSAYIATALKKPLPAKVTEVTKHHLLDTLAAMVSGSRLLPGERALAYIKAQGGAKEACVPGSRIVTTVVNAALAGGMLAHADETDDSHAPSLTHPGLRDRAGGARHGRARGAPAAPRSCARSRSATTSARGSRSRSAATRFPRPGTTRTRSVPCSAPPRRRARSRALDADQVRHMLSYTAQQASGLSNYARDTEHVEKAFIFGGMPARNGAAAATMVASGMTGIDDSFSGQRNFFFAFGEKGDPAALVRGARQDLRDRQHQHQALVGGQSDTGAARFAVRADQGAQAEGGGRREGRGARLAPRGQHGRTTARCRTSACSTWWRSCCSTARRRFQAAHDEKRMRDPQVLEVRRRVELLRRRRAAARDAEPAGHRGADAARRPASCAITRRPCAARTRTR